MLIILASLNVEPITSGNTYFPRVVRKWNSLESNIKSLSSIVSLGNYFLSNLSHYELPN